MLKSFMLAHLEVIDSKNPLLKGLKGGVVDETKFTIKIKTLKKGVKTLIKEQSKFLITLEDKSFEVEGKELIGKLEERIKKWRKKLK